ncbi:MAG: hypothetical protein JWN98_1429 [Abditibacteriota bacterium]|nr:hypothetical protein [Abditibacteriota bacterium]
MNVEFLGTAGYHPNEQRHTSCVYLAAASANHASDCGFVLDAGTGFFRLCGRALPSQLHIFLSHAHLDHICGLTYLLDVLWQQSCAVTIYGDSQTLQIARTQLYGSPLFSLTLQHATVELTPQQPIEVAGVRVSVFPLAHPGGSLAYRFDWSTRSLAYVTDTCGDGRYIDFIRDVDLLIHERNFANALAHLAAPSGHCASDDVVRAAQESGAKQVAITHINPLQSGDPMDDDDLRACLPNAVGAVDGLMLSF